ncbi:MAG: response regulator [Acidobacteriota bacterium]
MSKKILLADDSVTIQKVIELTFMDEDYEVTAVSNGDEALSRLDEMTPDIVIADVHMPGANGLEVCRQSKAKLPEVPVLLLVGTFEAFDDSEAQEAGADSHLKKPFDSQELLHVVGEMLAGGGEAVETTEEAVTEEDAAPPVEAVTAEATGQVEEPAPDPQAQEEVAVDDQSEDVFALPSEAATPAADWGFGSEAQPFSLGGEEDPWAASGETQVQPPVNEATEVEAEASAEPPAAIEEPVADEPAAGEPAAEEPAIEVTPVESAVVEEPAEEAADVAAETVFAAPAVEEPEVAATAGDAGSLSDADVDRIARRVAELVGDRMAREVAWEVIPDLAEVVIKDRLRELEGQLD